ncbi:YdeI/OmpD-associated family protein [Hymenobacter sp. BT175]|uniref:YdeI/OmpD-associated family protein n=1 Tax=Hymenobacter translucens TaxID=2886507 RepID=UPI001D0EA4C9|nr:YdeI/OmpD-associated family protein [Hymenobacter translucens]MCC2547273.1 YdeI/OmpD-associated family protein [Hymenobacter translucens]
MEMPSVTMPTRLEKGGPSFMPTQIVVVPASVVEELGGKAVKRVLVTVDGQTLRLGLLPMGAGQRYLMLNKDLCQRLGLRPGQELVLTLSPDPNPEHVELPAELSEALDAWPEAETAFQRQSGAMKRAMARHVNEARQADTRARRAVELAGRLARGGHPFRSS